MIMYQTGKGMRWVLRKGISLYIYKRHRSKNVWFIAYVGTELKAPS